MNRKILLLLLCCFSLTAQAENIAVVDMQRIITESTMGMAAKRDLEASLKDKRSRLEQMQAEIKQLRASVQKQAVIISPETMNKKVEELKVKERDMQRNISEYQEEFTIKNNAEILKIISKVKELLLDLGEEEGFSTVIEKDERLVVYSDPKVDFTDKVIELLNDNN